MNIKSGGDTALPGVIQYKASESSSGLYDAVFIGGGHNGLVGAAFMAKAGKRVLVLEARDVVGGLCWTREMDGAPGFQVSPCSQEFLLTGVEPSVIDQLNLAKYGLRWVYPKVLTTGLFPDGQYMPFYKDLQKTVNHIRQYSPRDAQRYQELVENVTATLYAALPYMQGHPTRVKPGMIFKTLRNLLKGPVRVARGAKILLSSLETVLESHFTSEEVKATLGAYSSASWGPISEPGGGLYMTVLTGIHEWGVRRPVGGSGQFTRALAACVVDHGGEVRVSAPVEQVIVRNGRAVGVALKNGEEIQAKQVVAATDPVTLATKLVDPKEWPETTLEQVRGLQVSRHGIYIYKADIALRAAPKYTAFGHQDVDPEVLSTLTLCSTLDDMRKSAYLGMNGDYDDNNIPLTTISPSVYDRSLVPAGSAGETMYFYAYNTPIELNNGRSWEDESERYYNKLMDKFELYAPGTRDLVMDTYLTSPPEFESRYNVYKGNYSHVDLTPTQMGPGRPISDFAGYRTPIDGLWNAASGSFPMSYLSGWPGRSASVEVLRALKKYKA